MCSAIAKDIVGPAIQENHTSIYTIQNCYGCIYENEDYDDWTTMTKNMKLEMTTATTTMTKTLNI